MHNTKENTNDYNQSINAYDSSLSKNVVKYSRGIPDKNIKKILKKQSEYLKEIRKDIDSVKNRKYKEDKKMVMEKVKEIEKKMSKNEEKLQFEQFKQDILSVT